MSQELSVSSQKSKSETRTKNNQQGISFQNFTLDFASDDPPANRSKVSDNAGKTTAFDSRQDQQSMSSTGLISQERPSPIFSDVLVVHSTPTNTSQVTFDSPSTRHGGASFNMSMERPTDAGLRFIIRSCVKTVIFPKVKFLDKQAHGYFSQSQQSVCGMLLSHVFQQILKQEEAMAWWRSWQQVVFRSHNVCRNNCIQAMRNIYLGMSLTLQELLQAFLNCFCLPAYTFSQEVFNKLSNLKEGEDKDSVRKPSTLNGLRPGNLHYLLGLRKNMTHYTQFLDTFAPAVVSVQKWNNSNLVSEACNGDAGAFEKLLSVSDEAFMLIVMISYVPNWHAGLNMTQVSLKTVLCSFYM